MSLHTIFIDDPDDPRIAAYRDIREKDLVGREGRFVAEGKVVLNVLFSARRFEAESALLLENRLEGARDTLMSAPAGMPIYTAAQPVLDRIAGFHLHRGVLAIGIRRTDEQPAAMLARLRPDALVLVLVGISNHDNVGAIFRNAAAFGADAVLLDASCCDPLYRKAIRVSVGAVLKIPYAVAGSGFEIADLLDQAAFRQLALTPGGEHDLATVSPGARTALYLGAEGPGLPTALIERLQAVRIAMSDDFDSLNVAAASAIALHRLWRG